MVVWFVIFTSLICWSSFCALSLPPPLALLPAVSTGTGGIKASCVLFVLLFCCCCCCLSQEAERAKENLNGKKALGKKIIVDWAKQDQGAMKNVSGVTECEWVRESVSE